MREFRILCNFAQAGAFYQLDPDESISYYTAAGEQADKPFEIVPGRTPFMDTYAMQAAW